MSKPNPALISAALLSIISSVALAQTPPGACLAESNDTKRLACYDKAAGRVPSAAAPASNTSPSANSNNPSAAAEAPASASVVEQRLGATDANALQEKWFSLTGHRTNYVLFGSYNSNANFDKYAAFGDVNELKNTEIKYQLSLKTVLWPQIADSTVSLWMAFTLQSWWQAYAGNVSAPFRETNYEPEIFAAMPVKASLLGINFREVALGFNHQSNGRTDPLSRSWNRITSRLIYDNGANLGGYVKLWSRIKESAEDDDNPNIERYMGQGEFAMAYRWNQLTVAGILKNNLRSDNKSGFQLDLTYPINRTLKGYIQGYTGYGENLIDGDRYANRIGFGLMLADWF